MEFLDAITFIPEFLGISYKMACSYFLERKETRNAFRPTIETLIEEDRKERGLPSYNSKK